MKILLTGGSGFIGSYVLRYLVEAAYDINVLARDPSKLNIIECSRLNIFKGDIGNPEDVKAAIEGCETVIHLAALVQSTAKSPDVFNKINYKATENLLKVSKHSGVKKFIFTSSLSACTYVPLPVINEESLVRSENCFSEYAESKANAEQLVKDYSSEEFNYIIIYPARVFGIGPLTDANGATKALFLYLNNKLPFLIDKGAQYSSWAFVEDVAKGIVSAVSSNHINKRYILGGENKTHAEVYRMADRISGKKHIKINLKIKTAIKLVTVIEILAQTTGRPPLITREWLKFLLQSQKLSSAKAIIELNYKITPIEIAMEKTIRWLKNSDNVRQQMDISENYGNNSLAAEGELV